MRGLLILFCVLFISCNNTTKVVECRIKEKKDSISYFYALPLDSDICYIYFSTTKLESFYNIGWKPSTIEGNKIIEVNNKSILDTTIYEVRDKEFGPLFKNIIKGIKENYHQ